MKSGELYEIVSPLDACEIHHLSDALPRGTEPRFTLSSGRLLVVVGVIPPDGIRLHILVKALLGDEVVWLAIDHPTQLVLRKRSRIAVKAA